MVNSRYAMNVSRIWKRLEFSLTHRGTYSSMLFEEHRLEKLTSLFSDKTHIHRPNMQQDGHFLFPPEFPPISSLPHLEQSSTNTVPTSDTLFHVLAISSDGRI